MGKQSLGQADPSIDWPNQFEKRVEDNRLPVTAAAESEKVLVEQIRTGPGRAKGNDANKRAVAS